MAEKLLDLTGKAALITGGSRGIGKAIALVLAEHGAAVAINSRQSSADKAAEVVTQIKQLGGEGIWIPGDISEEKTGARLVKETIDRFHRLDILVNNAGVTADNLFIRMDFEKEWRRVLETNLFGAAFVTKPTLREMLKQRRGGSIIFISSDATHGVPGQANYSSSKGGLEGLMRDIAIEYVSKGIRSNAVSPGPVDTELFNAIKAEQRETIIGMVPMKRMLTPSEIANAVLFLASGMSSGITGQVLNVDGGMIR